MARIRSIKPEFFTSETIASLPLSARLTFVGLWTYVDDNGVGLDNEMLINASVWPLEEDSLETLARTREDLATLSRKDLVKRYRDSRKGYLFVTSWDEHQKVDHPRRPRYPRPEDVVSEPASPCDDANPRDDVAIDSRDSREDLAPEQGSGIRDQGRKHLAGKPAGQFPAPTMTRISPRSGMPTRGRSPRAPPAARGGRHSPSASTRRRSSPQRSGTATTPGAGHPTSATPPTRRRGSTASAGLSTRSRPPRHGVTPSRGTTDGRPARARAPQA